MIFLLKDKIKKNVQCGIGSTGENRNHSNKNLVPR